MLLDGLLVSLQKNCAESLTRDFFSIKLCQFTKECPFCPFNLTKRQDEKDRPWFCCRWVCPYIARVAAHFCFCQSLIYLSFWLKDHFIWEISDIYGQSLVKTNQPENIPSHNNFHILPFTYVTHNNPG